jgi:hypothetical protein
MRYIRNLLIRSIGRDSAEILVFRHFPNYGALHCN